MKSNYFLLRRSSNPKVTGLKDGGSQAQIVKNKFSNEGNFNKYYEWFAQRDSTIWSKLDKIPDFKVELEYVRLEKGAELTDFLTYYPEAFGANFLLSEKAISVVKDHQLPSHKVYSARVYYNSNDYLTYYMLYLPTLNYDIINFNETVFYRGSYILGKDYFKINSHDEFEQVRPKSSFDIEELALTKRFDDSLDIFTTKLTSKVIISEKLKNSIISNKLTGANLIEAKGPMQMSIVFK